MDKAELRGKVIELRKNFSGHKRKLADTRITNEVTALPAWKKAKTVCAYISLAHEVDTKALIMQSDKKVIDPYTSAGEHIDLYIIPGVAFDRAGNRLGRGEGFYDKLLSGSSATKIALAYSFQVLAEVPYSSYDVPMDMIVTEKEVIVCRK